MLAAPAGDVIASQPPSPSMQLRTPPATGRGVRPALRPDAAAVTKQLGDRVAAAIGVARHRLQVTEIAVTARADAPSAFRVGDAAGRPLAVLLCSAPPFPEMVARAMDRAAQARAVLAAREAAAILEPLLQGRLEGASYALLSFCWPLVARRPMRWLHRAILGRRVLDWLHGATCQTAASASQAERDANFAKPLARMAEIAALGDDLRSDAERAIARLESGAWRPKTVLMHGDLWIGNVLLRDATSGLKGAWVDRFVIIDWPGSMLRGHAIFDLTRLTQSISTGGRALAGELVRHCQALECDPEDAAGYLLAALGHLESNLEQFPFDRFLSMATACHRQLERARSRVRDGHLASNRSR